jgi:hypothetical protein
MPRNAKHPNWVCEGPEQLSALNVIRRQGLPSSGGTLLSGKPEFSLPLSYLLPRVENWVCRILGNETGHLVGLTLGVKKAAHGEKKQVFPDKCVSHNTTSLWLASSPITSPPID